MADTVTATIVGRIVPQEREGERPSVEDEGRIQGELRGRLRDHVGVDARRAGDAGQAEGNDQDEEPLQHREAS